MIHRAAALLATRTFVALACVIAAGCCGVKQAQKSEPVATVPPAATPAVAEAPEAPAPAVVATPPVSPAAPAPAPRAAVPKAPTTAPPSIPVAPPKPSPRPPAAMATPPAPAPPVPPRVAQGPTAPKPAAAPLDLKLLGIRLRETKAIGVLTKLSLKNQVDDLLEKFRAYHRRQGTATLTELRRNYDMLVLKVLSLLQDSDPALARDIVKSRAVIWDILADPYKFNDPNLVAGATR